MSTEIDFDGFIAQRKAGISGALGGDLYAYAEDRKLLQAMRKLKPVELAVSATVRLGRGIMEGELLGTSIKVGPKQYPRIYHLTRECAETLGITMPTIFIQGRIDNINAMTLGTEQGSVIIVHAATVDHMTDQELKFVLGHECGHIQNGHVVHLTALRILTQVATVLLGPMGPMLQPALLWLQSWSRAAELTCDRAGLLCCGDEEVAKAAFLKLVCGSKRVFEQLNVEEYLKQLEETADGFGKAAEVTKSHPFIPKRIEALRVFAQSEVYRRRKGFPGGLELAEVDAQVEKFAKVM